MTTAPPVASGNGNEDLTFKADKLVGSKSEGKVYWKVKGPRFHKYGVTVWPEVLEETGFNLDELNPDDTYDLTDYTAHYINNDDGNPQKVVKLEAA